MFGRWTHVVVIRILRTLHFNNLFFAWPAEREIDKTLSLAFLLCVYLETPEGISALQLEIGSPLVPIMAAEDDDSASEDRSGVGGAQDDSKLRKRKERLEQNRISARESRKRKKTMIEELQRTVITLSRENKELNQRNEQLRSQLMEIGSKVCVVMPVCGRLAFHPARH